MEMTYEIVVVSKKEVQVWRDGVQVYATDNAHLGVFRPVYGYSKGLEFIKKNEGQQIAEVVQENGGRFRVTAVPLGDADPLHALLEPAPELLDPPTMTFCAMPAPGATAASDPTLPEPTS